MDISDMITSSDEVESEDNEKTPEEIAEDILSGKSDNAPAKDDTQEKMDLENLTDASNFRDPGDEDGGLTSDDNPFLNPEPQVPEAIGSAMIEEEPAELPYVDPIALEKSSNKAYPEAEDYFIDNKGRVFLNGKEITKE
jgi:hypothetical protein